MIIIIGGETMLVLIGSALVVFAVCAVLLFLIGGTDF